MSCDVTGNNAAGCHHGIGADPHAGEDYAARANAGAVPHASAQQPSVPAAIARGDGGQPHSRTARKRIIRKTDAWTDKDIVLDLDPVPDHGLVLDGDSVADAGPGLDEGMVADFAVAANDGPLHDMRESPNLRAYADLVAFAKRVRMNKDGGCE